MERDDKWCNGSLYFFHKWINEATTIFFRPSKSIKDEEITFGDLIIYRKDSESFGMCRKMCEMKMAVADGSGNFMTAFNLSYAASIDRWNDNFGTKKILEDTDMLMVTDIGDSAEVEALQLLKRIQDPGNLAGDAYEVHRSVQKVNEWLERNAAEVPEDSPVDLEEEALKVAATQDQPVRKHVKLVKIQDILKKYDDEKATSGAGEPSSASGGDAPQLQATSAVHGNSSSVLEPSVNQRNFKITPQPGTSSRPFVGSANISQMPGKGQNVYRNLAALLEASRNSSGGKTSAQGLKSSQEPGTSGVEGQKFAGNSGSLISSVAPGTFKNAPKTYEKTPKKASKLSENSKAPPESTETSDTSGTSKSSPEIPEGFQELPEDTSASSSPSKAVIMPSGAEVNFNKSPRNNKKMSEGIELELTSRNDSRQAPRANPMEPFIDGPRKSVCCISQKASTVDESNSLAENTFIEDWMSLEVNAEYNVAISAFTDTKSFYLQILNEYDKWDEMMTMIKKMKGFKRLQRFKVGKLCLVKLDKELLRGKVIRCGENSVVIFCVDTGNIICFLKEIVEAFEIPSEIVNIMPFQAINCRLAGVKAPSNYIWTHCIYQKVVKTMREQKIRVLRKLDRNMDKIPGGGLEKMNCYDVELFETRNGSGQTIGDVLVKYQLADYEL